LISVPERGERLEQITLSGSVLSFGMITMQQPKAYIGGAAHLDKK
jgi:hypothetical protein